MQMKMLRAITVVALAISLRGFAAEGDKEKPLAEKIDDMDPDDQKFFDDVMAADKKASDQRKDNAAKLATTRADLEATSKAKLALGSATVTIDEATKDVPEPESMEQALNFPAGQRVRDAYEINPEDLPIDPHERWSINTSDFKFDRPQYITGDQSFGHDKTWFGFGYSITNTTPKPRRIVPIFLAVRGIVRNDNDPRRSDDPTLKNFIPKGFDYANTGFLPERYIADSELRPLGDSSTLSDKDLVGQHVIPMESSATLVHSMLNAETAATTFAEINKNTGGATFEPGQTRTGAALWPSFNNEFTVLKIVVHGLTNSHRYPSADVTKGFGPARDISDEKMRRVMVLTFVRPDDEFDIHRSELKYVSKNFEYVWMWDQDVSVPLPTAANDPQIKIQALQTPAGASKQVWGFPFVIKNSTRFNEEIAVNSVSFVCPVDVTIGGATVKVEVKVVDDGTSTIYKAQALKALGKESPKDRWESKAPQENLQTRVEKRTMQVESNKSLDEMWAVFDPADVDWDDARLQIEEELSTKIDKKAAAKDTWEKIAQKIAPDNKDLPQKNPGILYDPRRRLNAEEFAQVKDQIEKGIPAAVEKAKANKTVVAYFDCTSGLATGSFRVSRSYRLPGVVQDEWLKAWEDLDK
jgi:hypothetical protein